VRVGHIHCLQKGTGEGEGVGKRERVRALERDELGERDREGSRGIKIVEGMEREREGEAWEHLGEKEMCVIELSAAACAERIGKCLCCETTRRGDRIRRWINPSRALCLGSPAGHTHTHTHTHTHNTHLILTLTHNSHLRDRAAVASQNCRRRRANSDL
jgi:hypothetical protein